MFADKLITNLVTVAIKNPRASAMAVLFLVVGFLGYTVKFLFIRSDTKDLALTEKLYAEIRDLQISNSNLQKDKDSLSNVIGIVTADGLRREIAFKDATTAELKEIYKQVQAEKADMAQELNRLQRSANTTRLESEKLKKQSHENN